MAQYCVVLVTAPEEAAERIQNVVVKENLAACVSIAPVRSCYIWNGSLEKENETLLLIKTKLVCLERLEKRVKELHPAETPEIIALPIIGGSDDYLKWVGRSSG